MPPTLTKRITASSASDAYKLLDVVVEELQHLAKEDYGCGILVTKTGPGQFTAELSAHVPYGITWETRT